MRRTAANGTSVSHFVISLTIHWILYAYRCRYNFKAVFTLCISRSVVLSSFFIFYFFHSKWSSQNTFQRNEFVRCIFFLYFTEHCGVREQSKNLNNIYCCFCIRNVFRRKKKMRKKEMRNNCCLPSISFWCAFFFRYRWSSYYMWLRCECFCVYLNFYFCCFFSFNFLRTFRQSVWYFHFANSFVYLAGSRRVRWTENICFSLHCLFF